MFSTEVNGTYTGLKIPSPIFHLFNSSPSIRYASSYWVCAFETSVTKSKQYGTHACVTCSLIRDAYDYTNATKLSTGIR